MREPSSSKSSERPSKEKNTFSKMGGAVFLLYEPSCGWPPPEEASKGRGPAGPREVAKASRALPREDAVKAYSRCVHGPDPRFPAAPLGSTVPRLAPGPVSGAVYDRVRYSKNWPSPREYPYLLFKKWYLTPFSMRFIQNRSKNIQLLNDLHTSWISRLRDF